MAKVNLPTNLPKLLRRRSGLSIVAIVGLVLITTGVLYVSSVPDSNTPSASPVDNGVLYVQQGRTGDCSQAQPCGQVPEALKRSRAGTTIYVAPGSYNAFEVNQSGITIRAQNQNNRPVITNVGQDGNDGIIRIHANNVALDGLEVVGARASAIKAWPGGRGGSLVGLFVRNCKLHDSGEHGILVAYSRDVTIERNEIYNTAHQHGIYIAEMPDGFRGDSHVVIRENTIYGVASTGIHINSENTKAGPRAGVVIDKNFIYNSGLRGVGLGGNNGEGPAIKVSGVQGALISNNFLFRNWKGIVVDMDQETNVGSSNIKIYNNTVIMSRQNVTKAKAAIQFQQEAVSGDVKNNIFYNPDPGSGVKNPKGDPVQYLGGSVTRDYNIYYGKLPPGEGRNSFTVNSLDQLLTAFQQPSDNEVKVTDANYMQLNPANYAFQHCSDSRAIDKGDASVRSSVSEDYYENPRNNRIDIGAFECDKK